MPKPPVFSLRRIPVLLPLLVFTALTGCISVPLNTSPLPEGFSVNEVTKVDRGAPFAVSQSNVVAFIFEGQLHILDSPGTPPRPIAAGPVIALAFSPDGSRIAVAYAGTGQPPEDEAAKKKAANLTTLRLFSLQGRQLGEATIPARVTNLIWRNDKELLASALLIRKYSFGSHMAAQLYLWDGANATPGSVSLNESTIRPQLAKLPDEALSKTLSMALSPYGDEIAYSALKDPPMFTPYLRIALRHLDTGAERTVAEAGLDGGVSLFAPDGESLILGGARGMTRRLSLPDGKEIDAWPASGEHSAVSPGGSYTYLDGHLYEGGREIAWFDSKARGIFMPDGTGLAISHEKKLFLVTGLKDRQRPSQPAGMERILELRRLRMLNLITDQEFKTKKKQVPAQ